MHCFGYGSKIMVHWRYPPLTDDRKEHKGLKSTQDWIHKVAELFKLWTGWIYISENLLGRASKTVY